MAIRRGLLAVAVLAAAAFVFIGSASGPTAPAFGQACSAAYPDFCIPPTPDVNCPDLLPRVNFTALAPDPHGPDADNDGIACEHPNQPPSPTTTTTVGPTSTTSVTLIFPTSTTVPQTRIVTIGPADNLPTGLLDRTG